MQYFLIYDHLSPVIVAMQTSVVNRFGKYNSRCAFESPHAWGQYVSSLPISERLSKVFTIDMFQLAKQVSLISLGCPDLTRATGDVYLKYKLSMKETYNGPGKELGT